MKVRNILSIGATIGAIVGFLFWLLTHGGIIILMITPLLIGTLMGVVLSALNILLVTAKTGHPQFLSNRPKSVLYILSVIVSLTLGTVLTIPFAMMLTRNPIGIFVTSFILGLLVAIWHLVASMLYKQPE